MYTKIQYVYMVRARFIVLSINTLRIVDIFKSQSDSHVAYRLLHSLMGHVFRSVQMLPLKAFDRVFTI